MSYRIWEESIIHEISKGTNLITTSPIGIKYPTYEEAAEALVKLAESNFGFSKYRMKKVIRMEKVAENVYEVEYEDHYLIKNRYNIWPRKDPWTRDFFFRNIA